MTTLRESLLPVVESIRGIPGPIGVDVRTTTVTRRLRTWSGASVGLGAPTDSDITISPRPKVLETMAGNEVLVGPITPKQGATGYSQSDLLPTTSAAQEVSWVLAGANGTREYELVDIDTSRPFRFMLRLRALERARPF